MKGKVIDMFSRKPIDVPNQDTEANDESAMEGGTYIGHIHQDVADAVRHTANMVNERAKQIDVMVTQWELMATTYYKMVDEVLDMLDANGFDSTTHEMQISEEGHVWIVAKKGDGDSHETRI